MGSNYFVEANMGGGGGSPSSSRKGKKSSSNSEKPKQPQRGLGVAQLEKIRLHGQMGPFINNPYPTSNTFITNPVEDTRAQAPYSSSFASTQSSSSPSVSAYGFHPNIMMGRGEYDQTTSMIYGNPSHLHNTTPRWEPSTNMLEPTQQFMQPRHLLNPPILEDFHHQQNDNRSNSMGSSSDTSDSQEVDLELRLSL